MIDGGYRADVQPVTLSLIVAAAAAALAWILSLVTREYSWVDRMWSIVPVVYLWIYAGAAGLHDARLDVMAVLGTLWGLRLTYNFVRKGGYAKGGEDYRWQILRSRMSGPLWQLFNLVFIAAFQNVLLWAITLPGWAAYQHQGDFGFGDVICIVVFLALLAGETLADQQQWNFHGWKRTERAAGREPQPGFLRTGFFRFSRHPNYFCEVAQWWVIFAFGAVAAGSPWQWTVIGAVALTGLFIGSTNFTEEISSSKYPEYADYRRATSALIPWPPRKAKAAGAPA